MNCKEKLETYLVENGVRFQEQKHPTAFTAQRVADSEHVPGRMVAKVVVAFADSRMVMLVLPAVDTVNVLQIGAALGVQEVRLAEENEFAGIFPDCELGAMPPFGNLYGLPVFVDKALSEVEFFYFQAGSHSETMNIKYSDFERLVKPTVIPFSIRETAPLVW